MKENELGVLSQYDIEIRSTRRIRGAVLCDTNQGPFLLKELSFSEKRIPHLLELYTYLQQQGYVNVDYIVPNQEGNSVSENETGTKYLLKRWFYAKECDSRKETDILDGVRNLACLHHAMQKMEEAETNEKESTQQEFFRHNRELNKVRKFMRAKVPKTEFEIQFLKHFDAMYEWAECARSRLEQSDYDFLLRQCQEDGILAHGDYNYHNLFMLPNQMATVGFEHFYVGPQIEDFYYFLRKTMEKNQWDIKLGHRMLEQYHCIMPISDVQLEYLAICTAYPEKYWKLANAYNRSNKAWISAKTVEKLEVAIRQTQEKKEFLQSLFSFSL